MKIIHLSISIRLLFCLLFLSSFCFSQEDIIKLQEANITKKSKKSLHYEELKKMPRIGLYSFGYTIYDDKLYIMSGDISETNITEFSSDIYTFDFTQNKWVTQNAKTSKVAGNYVFTYNNFLYSLGGRKREKKDNKEYLNNSIDIYDIKNDSLFSRQPMPHQAVNFAAVKANDNIILFGGSTKISETGKKKYSDKVTFFDLKTGLWYDLAPMPTPKETTGILVGNKVYLIGGFRNQALKTIETYDLATGKWENEFELPTALENPTLATKNGIIYMYEEGAFYTYNTTNKNLKEFRIKNITASNSKMVIYKNDLYLLGGCNISIGDDPRKPKQNLEMGIPEGFVMDWQTKYISTVDDVYKISLHQFETTTPKLNLSKN